MARVGFHARYNATEPINNFKLKAWPHPHPHPHPTPPRMSTQRNVDVHARTGFLQGCFLLPQSIPCFQGAMSQPSNPCCHCHRADGKTPVQGTPGSQDAPSSHAVVRVDWRCTCHDTWQVKEDKPTTRSSGVQCCLNVAVACPQRDGGAWARVGGNNKG